MGNFIKVKNRVINKAEIAHIEMNNLGVGSNKISFFMRKDTRIDIYFLNEEDVDGTFQKIFLELNE